MDIGFSTLGAPQMSFADAIALTQQNNLSFIEVRTLGDSLDMPRYFAQNPPPPVHPEVRVLGTSLCLLNECDAAVLQANAALAQQLGARFLRIFPAGGASMPAVLPQETFDKAATNLIRMRNILAGLPVELLLETHDVFASSERILALNSRLDEPVKILWDSHNTWKSSGESLVETWAKLGSLVEHIHYKDSVSDDSPHKYHYVLSGEGEFPSAELRRLLESVGYKGGVSLEWEKKWHPEIPPLEQTLANFIKIFR